MKTNKSNMFFIVDESVKLTKALPLIGCYVLLPIPKVFGIIYINYPYLTDVTIVELNRV